jgi:hypothetical protein
MPSNGHRHNLWVQSTVDAFEQLLPEQSTQLTQNQPESNRSHYSAASAASTNSRNLPVLVLINFTKNYQSVCFILINRERYLKFCRIVHVLLTLIGWTAFASTTFLRSAFFWCIDPWLFSNPNLLWMSASRVAPRRSRRNEVSSVCGFSLMASTPNCLARPSMIYIYRVDEKSLYTVWTALTLHSSNQIDWKFFASNRAISNFFYFLFLIIKIG